MKCRRCGHELFVALSCKRRGVCPSCSARRTAETAAFLVDRLLPDAPYRQGVLTIPFRLRMLMIRDHQAARSVEKRQVVDPGGLVLGVGQDLVPLPQDQGRVVGMRHPALAIHLRVFLHDPPSASTARPRVLLVGETERVAIQETLEKLEGNLSLTARTLQIDRNTLKRKMTAYGIVKP